MQSGTPIPPGAVKHRRIEADYGVEGFLIDFPEPKAAPAAFWAALVFQREGNSGRETIASARYFTLELGRNRVDGDDSPLYFLCEWTKDQHRNYGQLTSAGEGEFLEAVRHMIAS